MSEDKKQEYKSFPSSVDYDYDVQIAPPPRKTFWGTVRDDPAPFIGATVTTGVLSYGLFAMLSGNSKLAQQMMRYRILAQGATVTLGGLGVAYTTWRSQKNN